ncbi:MAG: hypothetical protein KAQ85_05670 [Thermodesulfovibrionia bacterium]|nr:hypothetical protein [Thermodesulfovibrionia bacterium]MCK5421134.1 hypothetical protein [Deltaproteobacteria bacterium]
MNCKEISTEIVEVDVALGVLINNTTVEATFKVNKGGDPIPESEQKSEKFNGKVLIPWRYIKGILAIDDERAVIETAKKIGLK